MRESFHMFLGTIRKIIQFLCYQRLCATLQTEINGKFNLFTYFIGKLRKFTILFKFF